MRKLFFYSQYRENYGDPETPHWKPKFGNDYFVWVIDAIMPEEIDELFRKAQKVVNYTNPMSMEYLISYHLQTDEGKEEELEGGVCPGFEKELKLEEVK